MRAESGLIVASASSLAEQLINWLSPGKRRLFLWIPPQPVHPKPPVINIHIGPCNSSSISSGQTLSISLCRAGVVAKIQLRSAEASADCVRSGRSKVDCTGCWEVENLWFLRPKAFRFSVWPGAWSSNVQDERKLSDVGVFVRRIFPAFRA